MENKIEVGEYIRTKLGDIWKITEGFEFIIERYNKSDNNIVKHSFNIIDLIEVGDVIVVYTDVSKYEVIGKNGEYIETLEDRYVTINDIKAILTKEMIENISYKVKNNE